MANTDLNINWVCQDQNTPWMENRIMYVLSSVFHGEHKMKILFPLLQTLPKMKKTYFSGGWGMTLRYTWALPPHLEMLCSQFCSTLKIARAQRTLVAWIQRRKLLRDCLHPGLSLWLSKDTPSSLTGKSQPSSRGFSLFVVNKVYCSEQFYVLSRDGWKVELPYSPALPACRLSHCQHPHQRICYNWWSLKDTSSPPVVYGCH